MSYSFIRTNKSFNRYSTFYDVYDMPYAEEQLTGMYLGEFISKYELEDNDERELFLQDLDEWFSEKYRQARRL